MAAFGEIVGFEFLKGAHLNDAVAALGSRKDRHAPIGNGELGTGAFENLMNDPRFDAIPLILETPVEERWPEEIRLLRSLEKKTDRKA